MDNTVGSLSSFLTNPTEAYILGLWGADRYFRTSSIGLSSINLSLLQKSYDFLLTRFPRSRIKLRIYGKFIPEIFGGLDVSFCTSSKNVHTAYHLYVNSRPLVREFFGALDQRYLLDKTCIYAYFAGRFDGDGSITDSRWCRIAYGTLEDIRLDSNLLSDIRVSIYRYESANTYCLYFSERTLSLFLSRIREHSYSGKLS